MFSVCLSVCLFGYVRSYLKNPWTDLHLSLIGELSRTTGIFLAGFVNSKLTLKGRLLIKFPGNLFFWL